MVNNFPLIQDGLVLTHSNFCRSWSIFNAVLHAYKSLTSLSGTVSQLVIVFNMFFFPLSPRRLLPDDGRLFLFTNERYLFGVKSLLLDGAFFIKERFGCVIVFGISLPFKRSLRLEEDGFVFVIIAPHE